MMQSTRGNSVKVINLIATLIFNAACSFGAQDDILSCNPAMLEPCPGDHQICNQTTKICDCLPDFVRVEKNCEPPSNDYPAKHSATAAVVTIFTLALVICGLVLIVRKYNLIEYLRQKINLKRNGDIMYEDVMIGQDDPPLTP
ncbi:uncharacterized protein LOC134666831 [Cydia fagiglandana]|uniref:uncharacterized protein LOC134666831 n=1 Tax=Cydia fagiglandana TaxID=1458189 RepID=UPI002FEE4FF3